MSCKTKSLFSCWLSPRALLRFKSPLPPPTHSSPHSPLPLPSKPWSPPPTSSILLPLRTLMTNYDKPRQCVKKQINHFADKGLYSQSFSFSSIHVWMWDFHHKEGWVPKNWWFWTVVLEKTLESPLDCKEIQPVSPKGNPPWIFTGKTDSEVEAPILWPPDEKSQLIGKDYNAGKDWRQEEKGMTEDKMVGWHHLLDGHEFEQAPGDSEEQGSLAWTGSPTVHGVIKSHNLATEQQQRTLMIP